MADGKNTTQTQTRPVHSLAERVLDVLVSRGGRGSRAIDSALLERFCLRCREGGPTVQHDALALLREARVPDMAIADLYIPAAARILGEEWCSNQTSFADVTIACARLQAMLRTVNEGMSGDRARPDHATSILVVAADCEYHTLGIMVLLGQLRRLGASVRVSMGQSLAALADLAESHEFDAILISAPQSEKLDHVERVVLKLRGVVGDTVPIVVGGASLADVSDAELQRRTQADHATNDLEEALRLCGLTTSPRGDGLRTERV